MTYHCYNHTIIDSQINNSEDTIYSQKSENQEENIYEEHQRDCYFYMDYTNQGHYTQRGQNYRHTQQCNPQEPTLPEYVVWAVLNTYSVRALIKLASAFYSLINTGRIYPEELEELETYLYTNKQNSNTPIWPNEYEVLANCSCNWDIVDWNKQTGRPILRPPDDLWYYLIDHRIEAISYAATIFRKLYLKRALTYKQMDDLIHYYLKKYPNMDQERRRREDIRKRQQSYNRQKAISNIAQYTEITQEVKKEEKTKENPSVIHDSCHAIITVDNEYNSNTVESDSLSWVKTTIGYTRDQGIQVIAVIDTACTHTTMKYDLFKYIPENENIRQTPCTRTTRTANGDFIPIKCIADITYTFTTPEGKQVAIKIPTAIVESPMACDVFLGSDMFTSGYVKHITPNTYLLTDNPESGPEIQIPKHKNLFPICLRKNLPTVAGTIKSCVQYQLSPGAAQTLHLHIPKYFTNMEQKIQLLVPEEAEYTLKKYHNTDKLTEYHTIMITNNSNSQITIPKGTIIGHIMPVPHQTKANWTMHQMLNQIEEEESLEQQQQEEVNPYMINRSHQGPDILPNNIYPASGLMATMITNKLTSNAPKSEESNKEENPLNKLKTEVVVIPEANKSAPEIVDISEKEKMIPITDNPEVDNIIKVAVTDRISSNIKSIRNGITGIPGITGIISSTGIHSRKSIPGIIGTFGNTGKDSDTSILRITGTFGSTSRDSETSIPDLE